MSGIHCAKGTIIRKNSGKFIFIMSPSSTLLSRLRSLPAIFNGFNFPISRVIYNASPLCVHDFRVNFLPEGFTTFALNAYFITAFNRMNSKSNGTLLIET